MLLRCHALCVIRLPRLLDAGVLLQCVAGAIGVGAEGTGSRFLSSGAFGGKTLSILSHEHWLCLNAVGTTWLGVARSCFCGVSAGGFLYGGDGRREERQGPVTDRGLLFVGRQAHASSCFNHLWSREASNHSLIRACSQDVSRCWMQSPRFCAPFPWYQTWAFVTVDVCFA